MKRIWLATGTGMLLGLLVWVAGMGAGVTQEDFKTFVKEYEAKIIPLSRESIVADFDASISGKDADYDKSNGLRLEYGKYHTDPEKFARLKAFRDGGQVTDPVLKRELDLLYLQFQGYQIDQKLLEQITTLETGVEQKFNTYRTKIGDREVPDNEVDSILRASTNQNELESVWKSSKGIGRAVEADVRQLTKLRNQAAKSIGFANYFEMQLKLSEVEPADLEALFDQLDSLTRPGFASLKAEMDSVLAARLKIPKDQLRPWDYQNRFFQEAPSIYGVNLDSFYIGKDPVAIAKKYYSGIGLDVDTILAHSDLYEKPGKYQHAYSTDVDRNGDSRMVLSIRPDYYWMGTILHELGHSVYSRYNDRNLPWLLRVEPHAFATEAVAEFFEALPANPKWMVDVLGVKQADADKVAPACARSFRASRLIFSRWAQVVVRFEREMYSNPDQDLNKLWWDLVEKYQLLKRPEGRNEPDWASKIHIATTPVYYYSYLMGELLASQYADAIGRTVLGSDDPYNLSFANDKRIGKFFVEKVFHAGDLYPWNEMIERATGRKLTSEFYAKQLAGSK